MAGKVSAGLLLYRRRAGKIEVLIVHPGGPLFQKKDAGAWSIPKGEAAQGEDLLERALIEFQEELGVAPPTKGYVPLGSVKQKGGKTVHAWAVKGDFAGPARSNSFAMEWPPRSGKMAEFPEVDRAEWFGLAEARAKLNDAQAAFVDLLLERVESQG
jgi:predicted NUDIX family NTP pyrophosphohydrolase